MRILFYATNGLGLGHVTRLLAISRALRRQDPSHEVLFLTRCEAGPYPESDDPFTIRIPGTSRAKSAGLTPKSYYQTTQPLLWQTIASFDPHLLVTDTFPEGPEGELAPVMRWPIRKVFVYRDSRPTKMETEEIRRKLSSYQMILVAHEEGTISLPPFLKQDARVHFTGTISEERSREPREVLRKRLGIGDRKAVLVTLGGGGDPEIATVLPIIVGTLREKEVEVYVATGPLARSIPDCILAREWFPAWPLAPWLPAFDLAVAGGGYNTVNEISHSGTPALLIPFDRDLDDQHKRILEAEGAGWAIGVESRNKESLRKGIDRLLSTPLIRQDGKMRQNMGMSGANRAAGLLRSLTGSERSPSSFKADNPQESSNVLVP